MPKFVTKTKPKHSRTTKKQVIVVQTCRLHAVALDFANRCTAFENSLNQGNRILSSLVIGGDKSTGTENLLRCTIGKGE